MPIVFSNPPGVHDAPSYRHAALLTDVKRRLVISGQVGTRPDGAVVEEPKAQIAQAVANLGVILAAHGMGPQNIVKMTAFLTDPALIPVWREVRTGFMQGHLSTSTLLVVAALADPKFKFEVEAEAAE
jgi:enamine deaminase RidA (YjgF/YER057c/UK114 family)